MGIDDAGSNHHRLILSKINDGQVPAINYK